MCDSRETCQAGQTYGQDLLRSVADKARSIKESGATPVLLQVGLDGLANAARFTDVDLYQELSALANLSDFRSIMVDAKSEQNGKVWKNVAQTKLDSAKVQIVNGLLMGKCEAAHMSMFGFSPRIEELFGVSNEYTGWVTSESKERVVRCLRGFVVEVMPADLPSAGEWKELAALSDEELFKYVDETPYRCFTPSDLLDEVNVDPGSLAMVVVDAEGEDQNIVDAFLRMKNFKPGFLQFEGLYSDSTQQVSALQKVGFRVGDVAQHNGGDSNNVLAVQPLGS